MTGLAELLGPVRRGARSHAQAWRDWFGFQGAPGPRAPLPGPGLGLGVVLDEAVLSAFRLGHKTPAMSHYRLREEVRDAAGLFGAKGWLADPASYLESPPPAVPKARPARLGPLSFERLSFESGYEPDPEEPGRSRWLGHAANRTAHAWVLRHDEPRPWLVCLHGAWMGYPLPDMLAFRAGWLHHRLGLNLAFPVMPLHGPRRPPAVPFKLLVPSYDVLDTVHALAQAVWDTRRLVSWIRAQGDGSVGVAGQSLGACTAALLAGVEPDLSCVIAGVPVVDFLELFERHAPAHVRQLARLGDLGGELRRVLRVVSPLALTPAIAPERRFIFAGRSDRIVRPDDQAGALWRHWGEPRIGWYPGTHVGFLWSPQVRWFMKDALKTSGLVGAPAPAEAAGPQERGTSELR